MDYFAKNLWITGKWSARKKWEWTRSEFRNLFFSVGVSIKNTWQLWTYKKPKPFTVFCKACKKQVEPIDELGQKHCSADEYEFCPICSRLLGKRL